ncbi:MAG TPA: S8 family serine peptidase [Bryobacteraceae bacterium]|nr:S8 family serine peptidase [Bryobacteraceae bacterium]
MKSVFLLLVSAAAVFGQVVPGRYLVELSGDPAATAVMKEGARFAARDPRFAARRSAVHLGQASARRGVAAHGGTVLDSLDTVMNALIVRIPEERAAELAQLPGVVAVHPARLLMPHLDHALPLHKVIDAWTALPSGQNSAGAGIKIGIIDSGIDVNNPAFGGALPALNGFPQALSASDLAFTNAKIIVAKNYTTLLPDGGDPDANDRVGHGTGTAMAAAGGTAVSPYGAITGVAPGAYLGSYKVFEATGGTTDFVIAKAVDDAVADGMDVLNLSLGGPVISYSDTGVSNTAIAAIEAAFEAGVVVTVSAGNQGPSPSTIGDLASAPDVIAVGAIQNDRALGFAVTVAGAAPYRGYVGTGGNPGQVVSGPLLDAATLDPTALVCSPLPGGSAAGMIVLVLRGTCTFESKMDNVAAGGAIGAIIYNNGTTQPFSSGGQLVGAATLPTLFMSQADGIDLEGRLAANPGLTAALQFAQPTAFPQSPSLTAFSSRGPSIGAALKPDLVAVGQDLITAGQSSFPAGELFDPSGFVDAAGTSFSAPLTAGAAAIVKSARPGLTPAQYRSLLINNTGPAISAANSIATVSQAGSGVLNVAAALNATVAAFPTSLNFGTPGTIDANQGLRLTITNVGTAGDTFSFSAAPMGNSPAPAVSTGSLQLDPGASQSVLVRLDPTGLTAGEYQGLIQVAGTSNPAVASIPYWFAVPGTTPAGISVLYSDIHDAANTTATGAVIFRIVDVAGLPFNGAVTPNVRISQGGGTVRNVYRTGTVPGTYAVDLRTGTSNIEVDITVGTLTQSVIIPIG